MCRHWDSPPGNVGLHQLHHGDGGLVDFDKCATENLSEPQHVDDFHHFRTDAFDPVKSPSCFNWCVLIKTWLLLELKRELWIFQFHYTLVKPLFLFLMINLSPMEKTQFVRNFDDLRQTAIQTWGRHAQQLIVNTFVHTFRKVVNSKHDCEVVQVAPVIMEVVLDIRTYSLIRTTKASLFLAGGRGAAGRRFNLKIRDSSRCFLWLSFRKSSKRLNFNALPLDTWKSALIIHLLLLAWGSHNFSKMTDLPFFFPAGRVWLE